MSWLTLDVLLLARLLLKLAVGPVLERKGDITMFYVGLDIAAEKHDCCIMTEERQVLKQFVFRNDAEGFEFLKKTLTKLAPTEEIKIGLENTGVYGSNLVQFLRRNGYKTYTFNPLLINKSIQATTLRKTKTDKADAKFLAQYLTWDNSQPDHDISYHISELKSLSRLRFSLVQQRSKCKTQAKGVLAQVFPELTQVFSDVFGTTARTILSLCPSAQRIAAYPVPQLADLLRTTSRGQLGPEKAELLHALAVHSVGNSSIALELQLQIYLEQITQLSFHICRCEAALRTILAQMDSPITTIPGIGTVLGATILGEIGDIFRFSSPAKLLSFAGLEPSITCSGKSVSAPGRMVKHGSHYLRWAFGQAARCIILRDQTFAAYASKKRAEGKHFNVVCSHVAKKLVRLVFALLKNHSSFIPNYSSLAA